MTSFDHQAGLLAPSPQPQYDSFYGMSYEATLPECSPGVTEADAIANSNFNLQYQQTFAQPVSQKLDASAPPTFDSPYISDYSFDQQSAPISGPSLPSADSSALGSPRPLPPHLQVSATPWPEIADPTLSGPNLVHSEVLNWANLEAPLPQDFEYNFGKENDGFVGRYPQPLITKVATPPQTASCPSSVSSPFLQHSGRSNSAPPSLLLDTRLSDLTGNGQVSQLEPPSAAVEAPHWHPASAASSVGTPGSIASASSFKTPTTPASALSRTSKQKKTRSAQLKGMSPTGPVRRQTTLSASRFSPYARPLERAPTNPRPPISVTVPDSHPRSAVSSATSPPTSYPLSYRQSPRLPTQAARELRADHCLLADPLLLVPYESSLYEPHTAHLDDRYPSGVSMGSRAGSPALSMRSHPSSFHIRSAQPSPSLRAQGFQPYPPPLSRHSSVRSARSYISENHPQMNMGEDYPASGSKGDEWCDECQRKFKDLKAHKLTHLEERPVKCPIPNCSYAQKGFSRKYDCQRHTLTHYKGTMVCDFCPGAGTIAEKSFNRADVFKRHLMTVHNVDQSPPNGRKKSSPTTEEPTTGKCSTCNMSFGTAQAFFEHLDECVYKKVTQDDPAARFTEQNLLSVADDDEVLQEHLGGQLVTSQPWVPEEIEEGDSLVKAEETGKGAGGGAGTGRTYQRKVRKGPTVFTFSQGGVPLSAKRGRKRGNKKPPHSWGKDKEDMTVRKRGLYVHDGQRRLLKDDMMLSMENEIRAPLANDPLTGEARSVTALDHYCLMRAQAYHDATEEEKGEWKDEEGNLVEILENMASETIE